jgi:hypothetical protein
VADEILCTHRFGATPTDLWDTLAAAPHQADHLGLELVGELASFSSSHLDLRRGFLPTSWWSVISGQLHSAIFDLRLLCGRDQAERLLGGSSRSDMSAHRGSDITSLLVYTGRMTRLTPSFLTQHEMETFLGGGRTGARQLQRLRNEHRLPEPYWLPRVDRLRTGIYPIFALSGLVAGLEMRRELKECVDQLRDEVFACIAFREVAEALRASVADLRREQGDATWRFDLALRRVADYAGPAVAEWGGIMEEASEQLEDWGVRLSSELGSVESTAGLECVVAVAEHREHLPFSRVAYPVFSGGVVAIQHVVVLDRGMDFLMPTIDMALTLGDDQLDWSAVAPDDWKSAITATNKRGRAFSFDQSYWGDEVAPVTREGPFSFVAVSSGREMAERLLGSRQSA